MNSPRKSLHTSLPFRLITSQLRPLVAESHGWIDDPSFLLSMSLHLLALAKGRIALIVGWEGQETALPPPVTISLPWGEDGHQIKAIQWLIFQKWSVLALGTTQGSVLFYSTKGALLLRQIFQGTPVLQLRVRASHGKSSRYKSVEEVCVVYCNAIARIDTSDLQVLVEC